MEYFTLNALPSIRESISVHHHEAPQNRTIDEIESDDDDHYYDSADEGFSFGISTVDNYERTPDLTADEMFRHGHILPLYSVSNHALPSRDDTDTDTDTSPVQPEAAVEFFDVPKTSPGSPMKSWSTGSTRRRNPIHEFLFGTRSRSDGKEKLGFFEKGSASVEGKKKKKEKGKGKGKGKENAIKDASKTDYAKNGEKEIVKARGKEVLARRRSFLPYIGIFGGGPMHNFSKRIFF